jgi:hypothetical protein
MRTLVAFLLLLPVSGLILAAQQASVDSHQNQAKNIAQSVRVTTDGLACSKFEWGSSTISDKSAMLVPISLNGKQYLYQLDTGADVLIPYGPVLEQGWTARGGKIVRIPNVRFAGMTFSSVLGYQNKDMSVSSDPKDPHGTVGLELLIGKTFVMDFPKQRVCLLELGDLPESLEHAADWSDAEVRHGKLYVDLELNGKKIGKIFYDTGSSPDALAVDFDLWKEATGKSGTKDATTHFSFCCAWGHELEIIGAPASGDLKIGNKVYPKPMMTATPAAPDSYRTGYWEGQGLLGNALFTGSIVILDLGAHPKFGIIDSSSR